MASRVYSDTDRILPRTLIRGLVVLVLASLAFAAYARLTDRPLASTPPKAAIAEEVSVRLDSRIAAGEVTVRSTAGDVIAELGQDGGGFVSTIHRVILRERAKRGADGGAAIRIRAFENGRMGVYDPATDLAIDLMGYGPDNVAVFATLITTTQTHTNGGRTDGTAD